MKVRIALTVLLGGLWTCVVSAAPNADGRLILHANSTLVYSSDNTAYCGMSQLDACSLSVVTIAADGNAYIVHAVAAFTDSTAGRLLGLTFGVDYDEGELEVVDLGSCGDFELATSTWPGPGSGTAITWFAPRSGRLVDCYWFAIYADETAHSTFRLAEHPTQGADFADDAQPANLDPIAGFGSVGFGTAGTCPCPPPESIAAGAWGVITGQ
jgi:hypothetical protein